MLKSDPPLEWPVMFSARLCRHSVAGLEPVNQGMSKHVTAKPQITQVLVDDGGTTGVAVLFGIVRY